MLSATVTVRLESRSGVRDERRRHEPGDQAPPGTPETGEDVCPRCVGSGVVDGEDCPERGGTGTVTEGVGGG
jgi:hypothetical protein